MKFDENGCARPYPGNTVLCNVDPASPAHRLLIRLQRCLKDAPHAEAFAFLPSDSFHMTLFRGVNDRMRTPGEWPRDIPLDMPLDEVTREFRARLRTVTLPAGFRMKPVHLANNATGEAQLFLEPADFHEAFKLKTARKTLSSALNHVRSGDDGYRFHITFSYRFQPLSADVIDTLTAFNTALFQELILPNTIITLDPPLLCRYRDMLSFEPVLDLVSKP